MSDYRIKGDNLTAIADAIREKKGSSEGITVDEMPSKVNEVYEAGEKSAIDLLWEGLQQGGKRTGYEDAFYMMHMSKRIFKPKYDFKPTSCYRMSQGFNTLDEPVSITEVEQECGITFDFSNCTSFYMAFCNNFWKELNIVDVTLMTDGSKSHYAFYGGYGSNLQRINRLICCEETVFNASSFQYCSNLQYVGFEGVIASNLNLASSQRLEVESLRKAIECLKNFKGTEKEGTKTFKLHANSWALLNETYTPPSEDTWELYVTNVLGWTI